MRPRTTMDFEMIGNIVIGVGCIETIQLFDFLLKISSIQAVWSDGS